MPAPCPRLMHPLVGPSFPRPNPFSLCDTKASLVHSGLCQESFLKAGTQLPSSQRNCLCPAVCLVSGCAIPGGPL